MLGWEGDLGQLDSLTLAAGVLERSTYVDVGYRFRDCIITPHHQTIMICNEHLSTSVYVSSHLRNNLS